MSANFDDLDDDLDWDTLPKPKRGNAATESGAQAEFPSSLSECSEASGPSPDAAPDAPDPSGEIIPLEAYADEINRIAPRHNSFAKPNNLQPWPAPIDFWREMQNVPEMEHRHMPPALADLFCAEAETWAADPGIYGMFGIGICAGALSNAITIQVKEGDSNAVKAARMWIGVSGYSGAGKTPTLIAMARPLEELQERLLEKIAYRQKEYIDEFEIYEKKRAAWISAQAKGEPGQRPEEPLKPARNRLIVKNTTGEAIGEILQDQGHRGILGLYDELVALPAGANQYKKGGNDIEELLKLRDGGRHSIDRKGLFVQIPEYAMNIVGGTQPDRIRDLVKRMNLTDNGFMQRFNFYCAREAGLDLDRPAHADFAKLTDIVERLYEMQHNGPVRYSEEAQEVRREFRLWVYEQRQTPGMSQTLKSHLNKYNDMFSEYALTYHAIESAADRCMTIKPHVSEATARRVFDLMTTCLFPHAKAFYNDVLERQNETMANVRYLAGKILAKGWTTLDLTRIAHGWTGWRKLLPWQKRAVLTALSEGGWIQSYDPRGYIEGMTFKAQIHPDVQEIFSTYAEIEAARLEEMAERREEKMRGKREPGED